MAALSTAGYGLEREASTLGQRANELDKRLWHCHAALESRVLEVSADTSIWAILDGAPFIVARQIGRGVIATLGFHPSQARDGNGAATALCTSRSAMAHCACRLRVRALRPWFGRFRWLSVCPANGCLRMCRCGFMAGCSHCRSMCWVMVLVACSCRAHRQLHGTDVPQPWQPILGGRAMAGYEITPRSLVSAIM